MDRKTQAFLDKGQKETTATNPYHILLAEDDKEMRVLLALSLRKASYRVTECLDGIGLLTHLEPFLLSKRIGDKNINLIISDIRMPGMTGMEILEGAPRNKGFPPMILITAFGDEETHSLAKELGAAAIFNKPFNLDDLLAKVHDLLPTKDKRKGQLEQGKITT